MWFALATAFLTGIDLYVTQKRIKEFGFQVELNPACKWLASHVGLRSALVFLGLFNVALLLWCLDHPICLHVLFGSKLSLAALQIKSLSLRNTHV